MSGNVMWQDKDVRFDVSPMLLKMIPGEKTLQMFNLVEDTKGNSGEKGCLLVTNLRTIWHSIRMPKVNITIGYNCMISITTKQVQSKIQGIKESLLVLTSANEKKYEFMFTNMDGSSKGLYGCINSVHRAYESSKMYRELKLRASLMSESTLKTLPLEEIYREVHGTYNLSNDQGNMGVLIITNVRVVWYAFTSAIYNVSIPYIQIKSLNLKESKFGLAIVIQVLEQAGGYLLGFRLDPPEKMKEVFKEMTKLLKVSYHNPIFGVECQSSAKEEETKYLEKFNESEIENSEIQSDTFATYCAEATKEKTREPIYNKELGLLIEKLPDGYSLSDLWNVL